MLAALSKKTTTADAVYRILQQRRSIFGSLARNSRRSTIPVAAEVTATSCCEFYGFTNDTRGRRRGFSSASSAAAVASNNDAVGSSRDNLPQPITTTTTEQLPTKLIDFETHAKIEGEESHVAMVQLHPGEILRAEAGAMLFMTEGVVSEFSIFACLRFRQNLLALLDDGPALSPLHKCSSILRLFLTVQKFWQWTPK